MENNNKKTFKELWNNKRTHAIIVLGMWFTFFALIFLILGIASLFNPKDNSNQKEEEKEKISANIPVMLENLIESNYNYEIEINNNEYIYSYNGSKEQDEVKGYYENFEGIIKYTIKDNIYYQLDGENLIDNNNIITEEDKNNINLINILNLIKEYENNKEIVQNGNGYIYEISENYKITIMTESNDINKIEIICNNIKYNMVFKNVIKINLN